MSKNKRLVIIDGKSVFYRGYYAMPNLSLPDGTPTGGVFGFAVMALEVLKKMKPDYAVVAWDKPKTNIRARRKLYPEYKANRKPAPPDFYEQIPYLRELLKAFGWPLIEVDDYEADDIMGAISLQAHKHGIDTVLVTSDLDVLQLVNHHTIVAALKRGLTNIEYFNEETFKDKYEMTPEQFVDYKALRGDPSDNIPGVKGVGEKTAVELIKKYGSLESVYENLDDIKAAVRKKLEQDKEMAFLSRKLIKIFSEEVPVDFDEKDANITNVDASAVTEKLHKFGFKSLFAQLPEDWQTDMKPETRNQKPGKTKAEHRMPKAAELRGKELVVQVNDNEIWLSPNDKTVFVFPVNKAHSYAGILTSNEIGKIGYDLKKTIKELKNYGIKLGPVLHDVRIGAFLINSLIREQSLASLVGGEVKEDNPEHVIGAIWQAYNDQKAEFKKLDKVKKLAQDIEWPMIPILADMEHTGVKLDTKVLAKMSAELEEQISDIEQEIYGYADQEFNISSPAQLADILYVKLNLPTTVIKKTKTGYSTAASELEKLKDLHPIISLLFKYREWTKLKNTYVDTLPKLIDDDSKLHTRFDMDVAPTGRLSSSDPNLQNIPIRSELGKKIRTAFVPEDGNVFVSADYSQFELRLAAHLSGEKEMIKAFNEGADVHQLTAAEMYGINPDKVTKKQRYSAKAVNFGIMYGQGPHGLSQGTGMSMKEAREFIDRYFEIRPNLRKYIDQVRKQAKEQGYVETIFGRRRPTPDVNSSNFMVREGAYRAAVNMPLQGSAADIMKMAMIKIQENFDQETGNRKQETDRPKMLLQIHDSVLVECAEKDGEKVAKILKDTMENVHDLPVNLDVDTAIGKNWGEL